MNEKIKQLLAEHPELFKTESDVWAYIRGGLRRGLWERSPMKHKFKQSKMGPPPEGYTGRGKKGTYCALSGEWTMTSKLEVDHIDGNKPLKSEDDIVDFIIHLLASGDSQLQCVSKEAHKIKSYAEQHDMSYEDAVIVKEAIAIEKAKKERQVIESAGETPGRNAQVRRLQLVQILRKQKDIKNWQRLDPAGTSV